MDISTYTRKDIGNLGERVAAEYFRRHGYEIMARNIAFKAGELDIVALKDSTIHVVEVKTSVCEEFPSRTETFDSSAYNPAYNLHRNKIQKVIRAATWYIVSINWKGEWQVDAALVWIRRRDGMARIQHIPQIL